MKYRLIAAPQRPAPISKEEALDILVGAVSEFPHEEEEEEEVEEVEQLPKPVNKRSQKVRRLLAQIQKCIEEGDVNVGNKKIKSLRNMLNV